MKRALAILAALAVWGGMPAFGQAKYDPCLKERADAAATRMFRGRRPANSEAAPGYRYQPRTSRQLTLG